MMQHRRAADWDLERAAAGQRTVTWEPRTMPHLSQRSIETLLDLVEIKLSCLEVYDREDAREKSYLENARRELATMKSGRVVTMRSGARVAA
jgi:hypothetical protein